MADKEAIFRLVYITALIIVAVVALFLLHVLGSLRRRSSNKTLHAVVLGAYALSYTLVSYTIGLMQKSKSYVREFPVWAVCLLMLLGGTDNLMAYGLNDVDNWKSFHVRHHIQGVLVVYIVASFRHKDYALINNLLWAVLAINVLQSCLRIKSMRMASKTNLLSKTVRPIANYMKEHEDQHEQPNPLTMEGYRYIVGGEHRQKNHVKRRMRMLRYKEMQDPKMTTVEQVWQCKGSLLQSKRGPQLKDMCLSMALSKMLNRRFAGVELVEAALKKTHDFVFKGLLVGDNAYERVFRVIEVELGFVHDLYYTRYPYLYHKVHHFALCLPFAMVILCSWITYELFTKYSKEKYHDQNVSLSTTLFLMAVVTFLEGFQLYLHMSSGWLKVALIRSYVMRPALQMSGCVPHMIFSLALAVKALPPWEKKLGQYSLLQNYDVTCRTSYCIHYLSLWLVDKDKKGRKRGKLVKLSRQVKQTLIDFLLGSNGHLTNGTRSLKNNGVHEQLSWACSPDDGLVAHTILVWHWHIATTICKQLEPALGNDDKHISQVASYLSQYCAYLVAFAPDLLPDHSFDTESTLDRCIQEAHNLGLPRGRGAKKMKSKCEELLRKSATDDGGADTVVIMGARLARQLTDEIHGSALRWKVLSDFWAEMVLYVAPCDDDKARAHLQARERRGVSSRTCGRCSITLACSRDALPGKRPSDRSTHCTRHASPRLSCITNKRQ